MWQGNLIPQDSLENNNNPEQEQQDEIVQKNREDIFYVEQSQNSISDLVDKRKGVSVSTEDITESGLVWMCEKYSHSEVIQFCELTDTQLQDGQVDLAHVKEKLKSVIVSCIDKNIQSHKGKCLEKVRSIVERDEVWDVAFLSQMSFNLFDSATSTLPPAQVKINKIDMKQFS